MSGKKLNKDNNPDYRIIFNAITNLMAFTELESGRIIDVNTSWIRATGISCENAVGRTALELGLWASRTERDECITELKKKEKIVDFEINLKMKSKELPYLVSAEIVKMDGKQYLLWEFRDISELKRMNEILIKNEKKVKSLLAESEKSRRALLGILEDEKLAKEALSENEEIFRCFMEYSPIYVFFKDENIRSIRLSKNYEKMLGKSISELLDKNMDELFPSELAKSMVEDDKKILKEGKQIIVEEEFNGRFYSTIKFPIFIEGKPLYLAGYTIDITERKHVEEQLKESEAKFSKIFQVNPLVMTIIKLKDGQWIDVNESFEKLFGYRRDESIGHSPIELGLYEDPRKYDEARQILLKSGRLRDFEVHYRVKNGNTITCLLSVEPIELAGEPCAIIAILDITERKQSEKKIMQSLREKETLIRELYHRTKNTMQVIRSMLLLQAEKYPVNSEIQQLIKNTDDRIQAISLVHQMLYKSHDLSQISIKDYINELTSLIMQSFGASPDRISLNIKVDDQYFLIDTAVPFGLILNELMTNSLKYAFPDNRKGIINILLKKKESDICILNYSDNGIGVPDGFDFRNQNTLGLKLIHGIGEEQLLGKIVMENKNGVKFMLEFSNKYYKEPGDDSSVSFLVM